MRTFYQSGQRVTEAAFCREIPTPANTVRTTVEIDSETIGTTTLSLYRIAIREPGNPKPYACKYLGYGLHTIDNADGGSVVGQIESADASTMLAIYEERRKALTDAVAATVAESVQGAGFTVEHTGGGCLAYRKDAPGGGFYLLTDLGGIALPDDPSAPCALGLYIGATQDEGTVIECATLAAALEMTGVR